MNHENPTTVLFFGTSVFAIPSLEALKKAGCAIAGVVTKPDEPAGRNLEITPPPVKKWATKNKIPAYQPVILELARLASLGEAGGTWNLEEIPEADIFVVAAYGKIIPRKIFEAPRYGTLNIHPSLLPRWRGPSPIQYAILNGDTETGVTIIKLDEMMDHGPIIKNSKFEIRNSKSRYPELHDRLAHFGAALLVKTLPQWIAGEITPMPQDETQATWSHKITKDDGRINWQKPAEEVERRVRAFTPWPGAWTMWHDTDVPKRIRIDEAEVIGEEPMQGAPGFVWQKAGDKKSLLVRTGRGSIEVKKLTLEGKKSLTAAEFLRGYSSFSESLLV